MLLPQQHPSFLRITAQLFCINQCAEIFLSLQILGFAQRCCQLRFCSDLVDDRAAILIKAALAHQIFNFDKRGQDCLSKSFGGFKLVSAGDYSIDPKINNTVFRNGVLASFPTLVSGRKMAFEVSFILTNYTGSALYSNRYQEVGVALGTNKGANSARSYFRAGATYLTGENGITGARLNLGYWF